MPEDLSWFVISLFIGYQNTSADDQALLILHVQNLNLEIILHPKLIAEILAGVESSQHICKLPSKTACERVALWKGRTWGWPPECLLNIY